MSIWETTMTSAEEEASVRRHEFEGAVRLESARLLSLAFSILRDAGDAEDAVQETMVRAWRAWESLADPDRRGAWLTRICVNHCLRSRRRSDRWLLWSDRRTDDADPAYLPTIDESDLDIDRAFRRLTLHQRTVITLHYHYGYSLDECAELIACRPGTVRSHLARALATLRREITHG
ncbi:MAG TPA: sigma-70 family RNA polymerase sigma factor [Candidatus Dormibacteraeota bacterium]